MIFCVISQSKLDSHEERKVQNSQSKSKDLKNECKDCKSKGCSTFQCKGSSNSKNDSNCKSKEDKESKECKKCTTLFF